MKSHEVRSRFLKYFKNNGHSIVESAPLPINGDPTLLFNAAGMAPLKPYFLGEKKPPNKRLASCQKCIRTIDIDSVGKTPRHCTFFEMLGNFSIGDYFKKEAIELSWDFLLSELHLKPDNLWVTVYKDDFEAADIWIKEIGFPKDKLLFLDDDNFWSMGSNGPCGPCSEIFYDFGEEVDPGKTPANNSERFMEIWNLVFMSNNKLKDGTIGDLPCKNIDTGMGLERVTAAIQGKSSVFDTDIFEGSFDFLNSLSSSKNEESRRVIADHLKSSVFLIADGVLPSNIGKGYVLRRILRRAIRAGRTLGINKSFLKDMLPSISFYENVYHELKEKRDFVSSVIEGEELLFKKTVSRGERELELQLVGFKDKKIPGSVLFEMYDTYGLPLEISEDIASFKGLEIDYEGFEEGMKKQRERSKSDRIKKDDAWTYKGENHPTSREEGYVLESEVKSYSVKKDKTRIIVDKTCFYPEGGGQIGDKGRFLDQSGKLVLDVKKTFWDRGKLIHEGKADTEFKIGDFLKTKINKSHRYGCERAHTATHLLHAALRLIYGDSVTQAGSLVENDRLRFDVTLNENISDSDIAKIEKMVSQWIASNCNVNISFSSLKEARSIGAMALFGEKYDAEKVRVVSIGDEVGENFSIELCGGTHVEKTSQIGSFIISNFSSIAQGVKRFEAFTGFLSQDLAASSHGVIKRISNKWSINKDKFENRVLSLEQELKDLRKVNKNLIELKIKKNHDELMDSSQNIKGISFVVHKGVDRDILTDLAKSFSSNKDRVLAFLITEEESFNYCISVSKALVKEGLNASEILKNISAFLNGGGGGRDSFSQGGGKNRKGIDKAIEFIKKSIK